MEEKIGGELTVTFPEGFRRMTDGEMKKLNRLEEGPGIFMTDPERHIVVTVGWKRIALLASLLLSAKDIAKNAGSQIARAMKPYGCREPEYTVRTIAGARAYGFRYAYTAENVGMEAETCVLKRGRVVLYFNFYAREALEKESLPVWEAILASVRP